MSYALTKIAMNHHCLLTSKLNPKLPNARPCYLCCLLICRFCCPKKPVDPPLKQLKVHCHIKQPWQHYVHRRKNTKISCFDQWKEKKTTKEINSEIKHTMCIVVVVLRVAIDHRWIVWLGCKSHGKKEESGRRNYKER